MSETTVAPTDETVGSQVARTISQAETVADKSIRSAGEAVTKTAEEQRKILNEGFERVTEARRDMAQDSAENMHALMSFASDAHGGMQELQSCLTSLVEGVIRTNLRIAQEIFLVESPRAMVELQQRFTRDYFEVYHRGISALIRAANEASEHGVRRPA